MKKFLTFAICLASIASLSAQKANVDAAKKLSGKPDKIADARVLIQQAMADPETAKDANTYFIAGKIEYDAYDKAKQAIAINPNDPLNNPELMAEELLNGYKWFLQALPLDSLPNEKGEVKPKLSKDIVGKITGHAADYFTGGAALWDAKRYFPEAYQSFMIYADMPDQAFLGKKAPVLNAADRALAYYNAGLAAYYGNSVKDAAPAFHKSRLAGTEDPNVYIYELACWQNLAQNDSTMASAAEKNIFEIAKAGYEKFGLEQPVFLTNLVSTYVQGQDYNSALSTVNNLLASNPDNPMLYGLLGFIQDRAGNSSESIANYMKAASYPDCDYETLKNTAKKLLLTATDKMNEVAPNDREGKLAILRDYYKPAQEIANRAKSMKQDDSDIDYVLNNINYAIETYFPSAH